MASCVRQNRIRRFEDLSLFLSVPLYLLALPPYFHPCDFCHVATHPNPPLTPSRPSPLFNFLGIRVVPIFLNRTKAVASVHSPTYDTTLRKERESVSFSTKDVRPASYSSEQGTALTVSISPVRPPPGGAHWRLNYTRENLQYKVVYLGVY